MTQQNQRNLKDRSQTGAIVYAWMNSVASGSFQVFDDQYVTQLLIVVVRTS
jgi:hypothetical protein